MNYKKCNTCNNILPATTEYFNRASKNNDGLRNRCKSCRSTAYQNPKGERLICQHCGRGYIPKSKERDKYCSRECYFESIKSKPKLKITHYKYCAVCKREFKVRASSDLYCGERCRTERKREQSKRKWHTYVRNKYKASTYICQECGQKFQPEYGNKKRTYCSDACAKRKSSRIGKAVRRARKRGNGYESVDPLMILDRDKWKCQNCNIKTPKILRGTIEDNAPEVDHIIPLAVGGKHVNYNLQCLCRKCNQLKGDTIEGQLLLFAGVEYNG